MYWKPLTWVASAFILVNLALAKVTPDEQASFNVRFKALLGDKTLTVKEAEKGMEIPLNSIFVTKALSGKSEDPVIETQVTLAFRRQQVNPLIISSLFGKRDGGSVFPFTERGIETVLTREWLKVIIHQGVTLHLRNDLPGLPAIRIFVSEDVVGLVAEVRGRTLVSTDKEVIKERLTNVWTQYSLGAFPCVLGENCLRNPDGSFTADVRIEEEDLKKIPRFYPPRIENK